MGKIVTFANEIHKNTDKLKKLMLEAVLFSRDNKQELEFDEDEQLEFLENYVLDVIIKTENHNWFATEEKQERFIEYYNELTNEEDKVTKMFYQLELIYLVDLDHSLLAEDKNYLKILLKGLDQYFQEDISITNIQFVKEILNKLKTKPIKETLIQKENQINNAIELLLEGNDPLTVSNSINKKETEEEDLSKGILTIERVHNYYYKQALFLASIKKAVQEHTMKRMKASNDSTRKEIYYYSIVDDTNRMLYLKKFPEEYQTIFLTLIRELNEKDINIVKNINAATTLTDILLHYENKINDLDICTIRNLMYYAASNYDLEINYDELDEMIEEKRRK